MLQQRVHAFPAKLQLHVHSLLNVTWRWCVSTCHIPCRTCRSSWRCCWKYPGLVQQRWHAWDLGLCCARVCCCCHHHPYTAVASLLQLPHNWLRNPKLCAGHCEKPAIAGAAAGASGANTQFVTASAARQGKSHWLQVNTRCGWTPSTAGATGRVAAAAGVASAPIGVCSLLNAWPWCCSHCGCCLSCLCCH